jgi:hypothetical protein
MSDYYRVQEVGGTELGQHYPDRGLIPDVDWHQAVLTAGKKAGRFWGLFQESERFIAVLSANTDGLRIVVSLDNFAIYIPWPELSVSAERSRPGTVVRLQTTAVPQVSLMLHLDDEAADNLFARVMETPARRNPPGRLFWPKPWAVAALVAVMLAAAGVLAILQLSWRAHVAVVAALAVVLSLLWTHCRPILEEDP